MIRYGIIGCGEHALRGHALPGAAVGLRLVGLCDPGVEARYLIDNDIISNSEIGIHLSKDGVYRGGR